MKDARVCKKYEQVDIGLVSQQIRQVKSIIFKPFQKTHKSPKFL